MASPSQPPEDRLEWYPREQPAAPQPFDSAAAFETPTFEQSDDGLDSATTSTNSLHTLSTAPETTADPVVVDVPVAPHRPEPPPPSGSPVMAFGTLVVIGAIAANVFGFRYSRWAVGKDVHRAWQNYERASRARTSSSSSTSNNSNHSNSSSSRQQHNFYASAQEFARQQARRAAANEQMRRARAARQANARAERSARDATRRQHESWERTFRGPDGSFYQQSFRMDVDPRMFEEMFGGRSNTSSSSTSTSSSSRGRAPFGIPEEVLQELLRAAQQAEEGAQRTGATSRGRAGRVEDFDAFHFWEQMNRRGGFDQAFGGTGSGAGTGAYGRAGLTKHFTTLGLQQGASDAEVKKAYRKEAMKWHPDRYRGTDKALADRKFREVTEAYNALSGK